MEIERNVTSTPEAGRVVFTSGTTWHVQCGDIRAGDLLTIVDGARNTLGSFGCVEYSTPLFQTWETWQSTSKTEGEIRFPSNLPLDNVEHRIPWAEGNLASLMLDLWDDEDDGGWSEYPDFATPTACSPTLGSDSPGCFFADRNEGHSLSISELLKPLAGRDGQGNPRRYFGASRYVNDILGDLWRSRASLVDQTFASEIANYHSFFSSFVTGTPLAVVDGGSAVAGGLQCQPLAVAAQPLWSSQLGEAVAASTGPGLKYVLPAIPGPGWGSEADPPGSLRLPGGSWHIEFPAFAVASRGFLQHPSPNTTYSGTIAFYDIDGAFVSSLVDRSERARGLGRALAFGDYNGDGVIDLLATANSDASGLDLIEVWLGVEERIDTSGTGSRFPTIPLPGQDCEERDTFFRARPVVVTTGLPGMVADPRTGRFRGLDCAYAVGDVNDDGLQDFVVCDHRGAIGGYFGNSLDRMLLILGRSDTEIAALAPGALAPDYYLTHAPWGVRDENLPFWHHAIAEDLFADASDDLLVGTTVPLLTTSAIDIGRVAVFEGGAQKFPKRTPTLANMILVEADCDLRVDSSAHTFACLRDEAQDFPGAVAFGQSLALLPAGSFVHSFMTASSTPLHDATVTGPVLVVGNIMPGVISGYEIVGQGSAARSAIFRHAFTIEGGRFKGIHDDAAASAWDEAFVAQFGARARAWGLDAEAIRFHELDEVVWYGSSMASVGDLDGDGRANDLVVTSSLSGGLFAHMDLRDHVSDCPTTNAARDGNDCFVVAHPVSYLAGTTLGTGLATPQARRPPLINRYQPMPRVMASSQGQAVLFAVGREVLP
jgi:hypothetical protein